MVPVLGDLVISLETAERQAQERDIRWREVHVRSCTASFISWVKTTSRDDERAEMAAAEDALPAALPAMPEWPTTSGLIGRQGDP